MRVLSFIYPPGFDGDETWPHPEDDILAALRAVREHTIGLVVPLTEESVMLAGIVNQERRLGGLHRQSALACVDRKTQRELLPDDLSPRSAFLPYATPLVAKARSSSLAEGVGVLRHTFSEQLRRLVPDIREGIVLEEYISGPQYEVNAVVGRVGSILRVFSTLRQEWDESAGRILSYEIETRPPCDVGYLCQRVANSLGLRSCGLNIEFRMRGDAPVVIEVHCRVGESSERYLANTSELVKTLKELLREET